MQRTNIEFERQRHLANWLVKSSPHMAAAAAASAASAPPTGGAISGTGVAAAATGGGGVAAAVTQGAPGNSAAACNGKLNGKGDGVAEYQTDLRIYIHTYIHMYVCVCVHNHITCVCTARHAREKRGACVWLCVYVWMREKKVYVCVDLFEQKLIIRGGSCCSCYCFRLHFVSLSLSPTLILCLFVQRARRSLRVISQNVTTTQRRPTPSSCRQPESYPSTWHNCCCNWYFTKISAISKRLFFFCASAFLFFFWISVIFFVQ